MSILTSKQLVLRRIELLHVNWSVTRVIPIGSLICPHYCNTVRKDGPLTKEFVVKANNFV